MRDLMRLAMRPEIDFVPCEKSDFEECARRFRQSSAMLEKLELRLKRLKALCGNPTEIEFLVKKIDLIFKRVSDTATSLFVQFAKRTMGFVVSSYNKQEMDEAMEECFGSLDKAGTGCFSYQGNEVDLDPSTAQGVFSLYLARKCWCPVHPEKKDAALKSFYGRVCGSVPYHADTKKALNYLRAIVDVLLDEPDESYLKAPLHDAACVELPKSAGGKRSFYYAEDRIEEDFDRYRVVPEAIYTGGKIRVITKDSAFNMRYAFLNSWMASKIRSCRWSIFGRSVEDWLLAGNSNFLNLEEGEKYLSGDLESATDLFNGELMDVVIERCYTVWRDTMDWDESDLAQMKLFTTRAKFDNGMLQSLGQLMGSVISFPGLCLVSFVAGTLGTPFHRKFMSRPDLRSEMIHQGNGRIGVNGDDIIMKTKEPGLWINGVHAVCGKVSRGKSLLNDHAFTVNSELWYRGETGTWVPPSGFRPSIVSALAGDRILFPQKIWEEFHRAESTFGRLFDVRSSLAVRIPIRFGGLAVEFDYRPYEFFFWRSISYQNRQQEILGPDKDVPVISEDFLASFGSSYEYEVLASREFKKAFSAFKFNAPPSLRRWSAPINSWENTIANAHSDAAALCSNPNAIESGRREYEYWFYKKKSVIKVPVEVKKLFGLPSVKGRGKGIGLSLRHPLSEIYPQGEDHYSGFDDQHRFRCFVSDRDLRPYSKAHFLNGSCILTDVQAPSVEETLESGFGRWNLGVEDLLPSSLVLSPANLSEKSV